MSEEISLASFETALDDLKRIVEEMESGNLSLEASLSAFERGIALTRQCQSALSQAQLRVQVLANNTLVPFAPPGVNTAGMNTAGLNTGGTDSTPTQDAAVGLNATVEGTAPDPKVGRRRNRDDGNSADRDGGGHSS